MTRLTQAQNHLIERHIPLAQSIALAFWRKNPETIDRQEVIAIANQGLVNAALRFDPEWRPENVPDYDSFLAFGAYAKKRITGTILDWQRKQDHVPRRQRQAYKELQGHGHGTGRSAEELSDLTGLPADKIRTITRAVESIAVPYTESHEMSDDSSIEDSVIVSHIQVAVADLVQGFPPVQRSVIVLRYFMAQDFPAIAGELGVSVMTVRTLHSEAIGQIHDVMRRSVA